MDQTQHLLRAVVLGASGASGRELVRELCASERWSEVSVIVRRKIEQWEAIQGKDKLRYIEVKSLDELEKATNWNQFQGYNAFFACLGARTKEGDVIRQIFNFIEQAQFYKVDFTYTLYGAQIAKQNNIPHFSLVSSTGADKTSMFLYMKTKGQIEEAISKLGFPSFAILRPGAILNRDNDSRFMESVLKYTPFVSKIECRDLSRAMMLEAEQSLSKEIGIPRVTIYDNAQLLAFLRPQNQNQKK